MLRCSKVTCSAPLCDAFLLFSHVQQPRSSEIRSSCSTVRAIQVVKRKTVQLPLNASPSNRRLPASRAEKSSGQIKPVGTALLFALTSIAALLREPSPPTAHPRRAQHSARPGAPPAPSTPSRPHPGPQLGRHPPRCGDARRPRGGSWRGCRGGLARGGSGGAEERLRSRSRFCFTAHRRGDEPPAATVSEGRPGARGAVRPPLQAPAMLPALPDLLQGAAPPGAPRGSLPALTALWFCEELPSMPSSTELWACLVFAFL